MKRASCKQSTFSIIGNGMSRSASTHTRRRVDTEAWLRIWWNITNSARGHETYKFTIHLRARAYQECSFISTIRNTLQPTYLAYLPALFTPCSIKRRQHTQVLSLSNLNRFSFFHCSIPWWICSKMIIKNPTTSSSCCHTTLWKISVRKQAINERL